MYNRNSNQNGNSRKIKQRRVIALLKREEMEYLDRLGMDSLFSTGSKLSRVEIIGAFVDAAMLLGISAKEVRTKQELVQKILDTMQYGQERRELPRLKKDLIVRFRRIESAEQYESGMTEDVGIGGFRVDVAFLGKPFIVNQPIEISINEPQQGAEPIKAIGRVAWIREQEDNHSHEIGVMITYIKEGYKEKFLKYLAEETKNKEINKDENT